MSCARDYVVQTRDNYCTFFSFKVSLLRLYTPKGAEKDYVLGPMTGA